MLGITRVKEDEDEVIEKILKILKQHVGHEGKYLKRGQTSGTYIVVPENEARSSEFNVFYMHILFISLSF
jgi:hypothetical protein